MVPRGSRRKWVRYEVALRTARGDSQRMIANALEIDRKTVRRLQKELADERKRDDQEPPAELLAKRAARPSKLDPYLDIIKALLEQYPEIVMPKEQATMNKPR